MTMDKVKKQPVKRMSLSAQKALDFYIAESETLIQNTSSDQVKIMRRQAQQSLTQLGWPTRRDEAWQYTPLTQFLQHSFSVQGATPLTLDDVKPYLPSFEAYRMVFVDGYFDEGLSDDFSEFEHGLVIETTADLWDMDESGVDERFHLQTDNAFVALNTMLAQSGLQIEVVANHVIQTPVFILNILTKDNHASCLSHSLKMNAFSEITLFQSQVSLNGQAQLSNWVMDMSIGNGASVKQRIVQNESLSNFVFSNQFVRQSQNSQFETLYVGLGGQVARHQNKVVLAGENCQTSQYSMVLAKENQVIDSRTDLEHAVSQSQSTQLHKFVLKDTARGVFDGLIKVARDAQKTNAQMNNHNLLLSDQAKMDTKPQLEIYADDVSCSHGCTSGQMDEAQLFYMQARGIRKSKAKQMMVEAFLLEPLEGIKEGSHRDWLANLVKGAL